MIEWVQEVMIISQRAILHHLKLEKRGKKEMITIMWGQVIMIMIIQK